MVLSKVNYNILYGVSGGLKLWYCELHRHFYSLVSFSETQSKARQTLNHHCLRRNLNTKGISSLFGFLENPSICFTYRAYVYFALECFNHYRCMKSNKFLLERLFRNILCLSVCVCFFFSSKQQQSCVLQRKNCNVFMALRVCG